MYSLLCTNVMYVLMPQDLFWCWQTHRNIPAGRALRAHKQSVCASPPAFDFLLSLPCLTRQRMKAFFSFMSFVGIKIPLKTYVRLFVWCLNGLTHTKKKFYCFTNHLHHLLIRQVVDMSPPLFLCMKLTCSGIGV